VALQMDVLSKCRAEAKVRAALRNLPKDLDAFYDRMLIEIDEDDREYAYRALQWLAYSARPLRVTELTEAVIVEPDRDPCVEPDERFLSIEGFLEILPAGLITVSVAPQSDTESDMESDTESIRSITSDSSSEYDDNHSLTVQFAHFSVKEYLVSARIVDGPASCYRVEELRANITIAEACLAYLLYVGDAATSVSLQLYDDFILLHFAVNCWTTHILKLQGKDKGDALDKLCLSFLVSNSSAWEIWSSFLPIKYFPESIIEFLQILPNKTKIAEKLSMDIIHPLTWVSGAGLVDLVPHILTEIDDLNRIVTSKAFGFPLYNAAQCNHIEIVKMILHGGADANAQGGFYGNALQPAARAGHVQIIQALLREGADVNAQGGFYGNALQAAVNEGHIQIIQEMLKEGADVNAQGGHYGNALQAAALVGHVQVVQALLEEGADVDAQGGVYGNALQAAARAGHVQIIQALLKGGADVNAQGGHYGNALQAAAVKGNVQIIQALLKGGADVDAQGGVYGNALQAAARAGHDNVFQVLLQAGAVRDPA
jgi:ankyrin repeat protein